MAKKETLPFRLPIGSIKPFTTALRISGMAVQSQSDFPAFFSPRKVNLKNSLIREDDLPGMAKSWKMTYRELPKPRVRDDLPRLAKSWLRTGRNLKRGFDETSSLKPSSGDEGFQLAVSRNLKEFFN
jgi:hypothetical protein